MESVTLDDISDGNFVIFYSINVGYFWKWNCKFEFIKMNK